MYQFPHDVQEEVQYRMATGRYGSEDDVLRDALRALKARDLEVAAIREGFEDLDAGRVKPLREFDREFRQRKSIARDA